MTRQWGATRPALLTPSLPACSGTAQAKQKLPGSPGSFATTRASRLLGCFCEYKAHDELRKRNDDEAEQSVDNGVLRIADLAAVTT